MGLFSNRNKSGKADKSFNMSTHQGEVISINVGLPTEFEYKGRKAKSAIWKNPVDGKIIARGVNLEGDQQADLEAHGGYDKAVYAYASEDLAWWENEIGRAVAPGELGENLTLRGIAVNDALIGERWKIDTVVLEVSEPRIPCWRLGVRMNDKTFPKKFTKALRPGTYLRIIQEGALEKGDVVEIIERPDQSISVREVFEIYTQTHANANKILESSKISSAWRRWADDTVQRNQFDT